MSRIKQLSPGDRMDSVRTGRPVAFYSYRGYAYDLREPWPDERCGTYAGLNAHKYIKEDPCQPCLDAGAAYVRQWRRRGKCYNGTGWPL